MGPKIGQYIYLQLTNEREGQAKYEYKARITDIDDVGMAIEIPIHVDTGRLRRLQVGELIMAYFVSEGGVKNYYDSIVTGLREDTIKQVIIQKPDPKLITKEQRRNYLRVPADLEVAVYVKEEGLQLLCITEDLSGGGLSFIYGGDAHVFAVDSELACWLLINSRQQKVDHVYFECSIIRVKQLENGSQLVMARMTNIGHTERQKIMRFCFERQLELRK